MKHLLTKTKNTFFTEFGRPKILKIEEINQIFIFLNIK